MGAKDMADSRLSKIQRGTRTYTAAIIALFLGSMVAFGAEYCVQPIIPVFTEAFELTPATASLAVSFGTGGMACAMLLIASFARKIERKRMMVIALLGASLLAIIMAVSQSFGLILVLRLCQGMLLAGFPVMAVAYINEEFDSAILGAVVGIYISGTSIGGLVGRMLLSFLTDLFTWRAALASLGVLYAVIGVAFLLLLPKAKREAEPNAKAAGWHEFVRLLSNARLVGVFAIGLCIMGAFVCTYNFISYVLLAPPYSLSQTAIGFVFLLYFIGTVSSAVMGRLSDRIGNGPVICISILCMMAGNFISLAAPFAVKILGIGLLTYGFFGGHSAACSWAGRLDAGDKARISAMYMFFYYVGASVIGTLGGHFLSGWGWNGIVGFLTAVLLAALLISLVLMRMEKRRMSALQIESEKAM